MYAVSSQKESAMYYALTVNTAGIITGVHESLEPITAFSFIENPDYVNDKVYVLNTPMEFVVGEHIHCYREDGTRKSDVWCIENGYMQLPYDKEIVHGELVDREIPAEEQSQNLMEYVRAIAKEEADKRFAALRPLVSRLIVDKPAEVVIPLVSMLYEWKEGRWISGESLSYRGYPYKVVHSHDSTGSPSWTPDKSSSLFVPWHGISYDTALTWKKPVGVHEIYRVGEYMVFTDGQIYLNLQDTRYSPSDCPDAWQVQYHVG